MGIGYIPDETAMAAALQAAGPESIQSGLGAPAFTAEDGAAAYHSRKALEAQIRAANAAPPPPIGPVAPMAPAVVPVAARRHHHHAPSPVVQGLPGQPEPPADEPLGPTAPADAELSRIADQGAYAPGKLEDPGIPAPAGPVDNSAAGISADRQALLQRQIATAEHQGVLDKANEEELTREADRNANEAIARQRQHEHAFQVAHDEIRARQAAVDTKSAAVHDAMGRDFDSYWADKSTGSKVLAAISVALGAFGAGLTHGPNYAQQIIDNAITQDTERKRARVASMRDDVVMAQTGLANAEAARTALEHSITIEDAAARDVAASKKAAMMARMGIPETEIAKDRGIQDLQGKAIDQRQQLKDHIEAERLKKLDEEVKRASLAHLNAETSKLTRHGTGGGGGGSIGGLPSPGKGKSYVFGADNKPVMGPDGKPVILPATVANERSAELAKAAVAEGKTKPNAADINWRALVDRRLADLQAHVEREGAVLPPVSGIGTEAGKERARLVSAALLALSKPPSGGARFTPGYVEEVRKSAGLESGGAFAGTNAEEIASMRKQLAGDVAAQKSAAGGKPAASGGSRRGRVNGKPAIIYQDGPGGTDGTFEFVGR